MDKILGVFGKVPDVKKRSDDDLWDRMAYKVTTCMFVICAAIVSTKQFVGESISCWVPAEFTGSHEEYTTNFCWIKNTYYLPLDHNIPKEHEPEKRRMISYYQWVPIALGLQALMCYLPIIFWRFLNSKSGMDVNSIVEAGEKLTGAEAADGREKTLSVMTNLMDRYLANQRDVPTSCTISLKNIFCCNKCGRKKGNYLVVLYIVFKVLMLLVIAGQLVALNYFLGHNFHMFGFESIYDIFSGAKEVDTFSRFPRTTMCDFKIRRLGNVQRYTVQCVLPINLFNEKIYLFLWFWLLFVTVGLVWSIVLWVFRFLYKKNGRKYVKKQLQLMDKIKNDSDRKMLVKFVENYLRQDGVFVLRMMGHNTNALTVTEFVCDLWDNFRSKPVTQRVDDDIDTV